MKINLVLAFKSPTQVDWKLTKQNAIEQVKKIYADSHPDDQAILAEIAMKACREIIKDKGVAEVYRQIKEINERA